ncbi:hypothetical protein D3C84_811990 [compost metagenome]
MTPLHNRSCFAEPAAVTEIEREEALKGRFVNRRPRFSHTVRRGFEILIKDDLTIGHWRLWRWRGCSVHAHVIKSHFAIARCDLQSDCCRRCVRSEGDAHPEHCRFFFGVITVIVEQNGRICVIRACSSVRIHDE